MGWIRRLDFVIAFHWLAIWFVEILVESVGTSAVMLATVTFSEYREHLFLQGDLSKAFVSIPLLALAVLLYFGLTGYLITSAIASVTLRELSWWVYPTSTAVLYLAHSTLLFVGLADNILIGRDLVIQFCGAAIAFGCAHFGKKVLRLWNPE